MGMSTEIIGFTSPMNEMFQKHEKVLIACNEAGIQELPKETADFFGTKYPALHVLEDNLRVELEYYEYSGDMQHGFEIIVSEIPKQVHKIRFVNSW